MNATPAAPTVSFADGSRSPAIGLGTWRFGERANLRARELRALRLAFECGYRLVDTAEMYGEGGAESVVGEALAGAMDDEIVRRDDVFVVSKVYPHNAGRSTMRQACEASLKRLRLQRLDLYLLHWRGSHPLAETVESFEALKKAGKIRSWGVSNLDADDLDELAGVPNGGNCISDQVLYHLGSRGIEWQLLPKCQKAKIMVMAYSPLGQGPLLRKPALTKIAAKHACDPGAVALAWVLRHPGVVTIPKATRPEHVRANLKAIDITLDAEDLAALDAAFPPPKRAGPLEMT
jgi:diketogulonate reductase-like aldo/keto reductase